MDRRRKVRRIIKRTLCALIILYSLLLVTTIGFIREFHRCVRGDTENIDSRNRLLRYSIPESISYDYVESTAMPIFAIYGFNEGVMIVRYSKVAYKNGVPVHGAWNVISKWKLARVDGEWMVVEIDEHP